ncbi:MAG TPA: glycoside hydrolase family 97 N-terminal domain-containing protein, partial [Segatella copri]|nr:glycoside hydrolase family 97 N-terminal domain-containing protein [Segatella copri]
MKKNVLAVALALMASIGAYAEKNTVSSPDGKLNVVVEDRDGKLYYSIDYTGKRMMEESQLGLLANVGDFSQGLTYQGKNEIKVEKSYDLRTAKVSHVDYHANQLNVTYINGKKQPMTITFNVSNNDVAFRYTFDQLKAQHLIVNEEKTAFNLPKVTT